MIKKLRKKFIALTMFCVIAVLTIIITSINIVSFANINKDIDAKILAIAANGGTFPENSFRNEPKFFENRPDKGFNKFSPEAPFETRYFTVLFNTEGGVTAVDTGRIAAVDTDSAVEYATSLLIRNKTEGYHEGYKYKAVELSSGKMYIFIDCEREISAFYSFLISSISISLTGILLIFLLVLFSSKIIIKPFIDNYEKQKRFITDAGHEIKTPLTIIDAGAELIELETGESEWTNSIKNQVKRLSELTERMIFLAKMDEENKALNMTEFSISDCAEDIAESFFAIAGTKKKTFSTHIQKNVIYRGDENAIRQLFSILIDNAFKYSDDNGEIHFHLSCHGKSTEIKVCNTVRFIEKGRHDELFERFYRKDSSRNSRTGGHGIGLSCAKAIVTAHKGKISAFSEDGKSVVFTIFL